MSRKFKVCGWILVALLLGFGPSGPRPDPSNSPWGRLLGPFAGLASDVQLTRALRARLDGKQALALVRSQSAIQLNPRSVRPWRELASSMAMHLASIAREPDPQKRLLWLQAGLDVAEHGEASVQHPEDLAFLQGLFLFAHAERQDETPWPGGPKALWTEAAKCFERAERGGHPRARTMARFARQQAQQAAD